MRHTLQPVLTRIATFSTLLFSTAVPLASQVYESPADTGRTTWGRKHFSNYVNARTCDRAIRETRFDLTRRYIRDTAFQLVVPNNPDPKTPKEVIAIADACGQQFTLDNTPAEDLWSLVRILFARQKDSMAMTVFERRYSLATTDQEKIAVLAKGGREMFREQPVRVTYLHDILKRLDSFGNAAAIDRMDLRIRLFDYWYERYNIDSVQAYGASIIKISNQASQDERNAVDLLSVWKTLLVIANVDGNIATQRAVLDSALRNNVTDWRGGEGGMWLGSANEGVDTKQSLYGKQTRPLAPETWKNAGGVPHPVPGKLSIILKADHNCGTRCYDIYNISRQLIAQFGNDIDVTYTVPTVGYAPGSGPLGFQDEANEIEKYFVNYLKLPIALAVYETNMSKLDDGRIIRSGSSLDDNMPRFDAIIIDKSGAIRWLGRLRSQHDKRMIDAAIANILGGSARKD